MCRKYGIPADSNVQRAISGFFKAVCLVAMGGVDGDAVAARLERKGHVDDQALCASDTQVGMNDDYIRSFEAGHGGLFGIAWFQTVSLRGTPVLSHMVVKGREMSCDDGTPSQVQCYS